MAVDNTTNLSQVGKAIQNYISGLTLSTAGATATFGIAVGVAMDSTNAALMTLASAYTKTTSAWALGTAAGALDTGAIANSTWYHVWLIQRSDTSVVDVLVSLSVSAPTMPTNYDRKRRIGSMKTNGSAQWTKFVQLGDEFIWDVGVQDQTNSSGTAAFNLTLTVPTGVSVKASVTGYFNTSAASDYALISSPLATNVNNTPSGNVTVITQVASAGIAFQASALTNTSAQIKVASSVITPGNFLIITTGWADDRGSNG